MYVGILYTSASRKKIFLLDTIVFYYIFFIKKINFMAGGTIIKICLFIVAPGREISKHNFDVN